jgi:hypothetical protein
VLYVLAEGEECFAERPLRDRADAIGVASGDGADDGVPLAEVAARGAGEEIGTAIVAGLGLLEAVGEVGKELVPLPKKSTAAAPIASISL